MIKILKEIILFVFKLYGSLEYSEGLKTVWGMPLASPPTFAPMKMATYVTTLVFTIATTDIVICS